MESGPELLESEEGLELLGLESEAGLEDEDEDEDEDKGVRAKDSRRRERAMSMIRGVKWACVPTNRHAGEKSN